MARVSGVTRTTILEGDEDGTINEGAHKRGNVWSITYFDTLGHQRFESSKSSNKRDAEKRLVDRRKEAHEGLLPAPPIKPLSLEELRQRYLDFVGHQRGVETKKFTSPTSRGCGGIH